MSQPTVTQISESPTASQENTKKRKRSHLWDYFKVNDEDITKANCKLCSASVSRGGSCPKEFTNSGMKKHLQAKHELEFNSLFPASQESSGTKTLFRSDSSIQFMADDSRRAQQITRAIAIMIAKDFQPYSIVKDKGFRNLLNLLEPRYKIPSRKLFAYTAVPELYNEVRKFVSDHYDLTRAKLALTIDLWSSTNSESYLSLTAHFLTAHLQKVNLALETFPYKGDHTGERIASHLKEALSSWGVNVKDHFFVVHDNAANVTKAVEILGYTSIKCLNHTLQLVINDALKDNELDNMLVTVRIISRHFHRSIKSADILRERQKSLGNPPLKLIIPNNTRWNSTFYMVERASTLQSVLNSILTQTTCGIQHLEPKLCKFMTQFTAVLEPFGQMTKDLEADDSSLSQAIPAIYVLKKNCEKSVQDEMPMIKRLRKALREGLEARTNFIDNYHYAFATITDPRFRLSAFELKYAEVEEMKKSLCVMLEDEVLTQSQNSQVICVKKEVDSYQEQQELEDRERGIKHVKQNSVWDLFTQDSPKEGKVLQSSVNCSTQLNEYLYDENLLPKANPIKEYWTKNNIKRFPALLSLFKKYFAIPPSSSYSERLFSTAGNVVTNKRTQLTPANVNKLVFLNKNLSVMYPYLDSNIA